MRFPLILQLEYVRDDLLQLEDDAKVEIVVILRQLLKYLKNNSLECRENVDTLGIFPDCLDRPTAWRVAYVLKNRTITICKLFRA